MLELETLRLTQHDLIRTDPTYGVTPPLRTPSPTELVRMDELGNGASAGYSVSQPRSCASALRSSSLFLRDCSSTDTRSSSRSAR